MGADRRIRIKRSPVKPEAPVVEEGTFIVVAGKGDVLERIGVVTYVRRDEEDDDPLLTIESLLGGHKSHHYASVVTVLTHRQLRDAQLAVFDVLLALRAEVEGRGLEGVVSTMSDALLEAVEEDYRKAEPVSAYDTQDRDYTDDAYDSVGDIPAEDDDPPPRRRRRRVEDI